MSDAISDADDLELSRVKSPLKKLTNGAGKLTAKSTATATKKPIVKKAPSVTASKKLSPAAKAYQKKQEKPTGKPAARKKAVVDEDEDDDKIIDDILGDEDDDDLDESVVLPARSSRARAAPKKYTVDLSSDEDEAEESEEDFDEDEEDEDDYE